MRRARVGLRVACRGPVEVLFRDPQVMLRGDGDNVPDPCRDDVQRVWLRLVLFPVNVVAPVRFSAPRPPNDVKCSPRTFTQLTLAGFLFGWTVELAVAAHDSLV